MSLELKINFLGLSDGGSEVCFRNWVIQRSGNIASSADKNMYPVLTSEYYMHGQIHIKLSVFASFMPKTSENLELFLCENLWRLDCYVYANGGVTAFPVL